MTAPRTDWAAVLGEHRVVYESDGDYGELSWVECSCGDDYFVGSDADEADHRAHLAAVIAARVAEERGTAVESAARALDDPGHTVQDLRRYQLGAWLRDRAALERGGA